MTTNKDWELGSGLPDDVDAWIVSARFGWPQDYNQGQSLCLMLTLESADADFDRPVLMSIGNNWTTDRDGIMLTHNNGKPDAKIIKTCGYGQMIEHVLTVAEAPVQELGSPKDARIWEGLGFHWVRKEFTYAGAEERGMKASTERLMPVMYLGKRESNGVVAGGGVPAAAAAVAAPAPATAPMAVPTAPASPPPAGDLTSRLTALALGSMDQQSFLKAALTLDGVATDPALLSQVLDESPTGFWAKANS